MNGRMLAIQALSPIHVGAGQGAGVIDLPAIREATTGWPYLPGSSIKGVLRDACTYAAETHEDPNDAKAVVAKIKVVFGPGTADDPSEHAGGIIVGDQHLLCLAVRSWHGGFAWVSCPFAINRWIRDAKAIGQPVMSENAEIAFVTVAPANDQIAVSNPTVLATATSAGSPVYIEDLELKTHPDNMGVYANLIGSLISPVGGPAFFSQRFGIVSDTTFGFLTRTAMDVVARNSIDETRKIVKTGALWWEESVPAESIFVGPIIATPQGAGRMPEHAAGTEAGANAMFAFVADHTNGKTLQIGGNATVGRGLAIARLEGGDA